MRITKAVIPAAGLGTRMMPLTAIGAKEMLPLGRFPCLYYTAAEAVMAGIKEILIIVSENKPEIERYFGENNALFCTFGKKSEVGKLLSECKFTFVVQAEPRGLGAAVLEAEQFVGEDYFALMLPDELLCSAEPAVGSLISLSEQDECSSVLYMPVKNPWDYGCLTLHSGGNVVQNIVEKPKKGSGGSNLAVLGRYILECGIFEKIRTDSGENREVGLTPALNELPELKAVEYLGERYDTGNVEGYLKANVRMTFEDGVYGKAVSEWYAEMLDDRLKTYR